MAGSEFSLAIEAYFLPRIFSTAFGVMSIILAISSTEVYLLKSAAAVVCSNFSRRPISVMRL